jgi:hypothetical protein
MPMFFSSPQPGFSGGGWQPCDPSPLLPVVDQTCDELDGQHPSDPPPEWSDVLDDLDGQH